MLSKQRYVAEFAELLSRASTRLPADVVAALRQGREAEERGSLAARALDTILDNVELAREARAPICQDTGTPVAWVRYPLGTSTRLLAEALEEAVVRATSEQVLRPNAVDSLSGKNTGTGAGRGIPYVHFEEWDEPAVEVRLLLKGGGCENVGAQYKLPEPRLGAGRDLEGVRRVVLDAAVAAQGKGCAPGVLGVAVGGDRVSGFEESKRQLLRPLPDRNPNPELAALEERLLAEGNSLGIGPMGFGGKTTLLGVKIGVLDRLPASYFVTVSYMCWADRRAAVRIGEGGEVTWLS
jgi:tartrate/fumarate subfamily iron-sulfur-dependent hydro-lyase alpha chain